MGVSKSRQASLDSLQQVDDPEGTVSTDIADTESLPDLGDAIWEQLEEQVSRFEAAWARGEKPLVEQFLLPEDPTQGQLLVELVHTSLELHLKAGETPPDYFALFPELQARPDVLASMRRTEERLLRTTARQFPPSEIGVGMPADGEELPRLEGYEVVREVARGGMGIVYEATDLSIGRTVALKTIPPGASLEEHVRLQREAASAGRIQHPHVAQVFRTIEQDGRLFIVSEFLPGGTLANRLHGEPWPPQEAARLVLSLAEAVAAAHEVGIVHRDLKPANILFTKDEIPKVADFGLVKLLDDSSHMTRTGLIVGSPSYMAPEQATGNGPLGIRVDVWALGVILYELLTGRPPFRDVTVLGTLELVRTSEPVQPSRLVPRLSADLQTICLQCLQKQPEKRYATAIDLARDLDRYLKGKPVLARPISPFERAVRWTRANQTISVLVGLLITSILVGMFLVLAYGLEAQEAAMTAQNSAFQADEAARAARASEAKEIAARQEAEREKERFERMMLANSLGPAAESLSTGSAAVATDLVTTVGNDQEPGIQFLINYLDRLSRTPGQVIEDVEGSIYFLRFSPDGEYLVACGQSGVIHFYHADTWQPAWKLDSEQIEVNSVSFNKQGTRFASAGDDGTVVLWDMATKQRLWTTKVFERPAFEVEYVKDDTEIAVGGRDVNILLLDAKDGKVLHTLKGHNDTVQTMEVTPDGRSMLTTSDDQLVIHWDLDRREERWRYMSSFYSTAGFCMSSDGKRVLLGTLDGVIIDIDVATGKVLHEARLSATNRLNGITDAVHALMLPDPTAAPTVVYNRRAVVETEYNEDLLLPDRQSPRPVWQLPGSRIRTMIRDRDNPGTITGNNAGEIRLWHRLADPAWFHIDLPILLNSEWIKRPTGDEVLLVNSHGPETREGFPSPRILWAIHPETREKTPLLVKDHWHIDATPDGRLVILSGSEMDFDHAIVAYDLSTPKPRLLWEINKQEAFRDKHKNGLPVVRTDVFDAQVSRAGDRVFVVLYIERRESAIATLREKTLISLDGSTGAITNSIPIPGDSGPIHLAPSGEYLLLLGSAEEEVMMFNANLEKLPVPWKEADQRGVATAAFSSDGQLVAFRTDGDEVLVYRVGESEPLIIRRMEGDIIRGLEFHPRGYQLLLSSEHTAPRILDVESGVELMKLGTQPVVARNPPIWDGARFSLDGNWVSVVAGETVTFFDGRPMGGRVEVPQE